MDKTLKELFSASPYIKLNKTISSKIGITNGIVLSLLIEKSIQENTNYFSYSIEDLINDSTLSKGRQAKAINKLNEMNLIKLERKGLYHQRYFSINISEVIKMLNNKTEI